MHFRSIGFALSLTLLTGCLSLAPSKRHREEACDRGAKEFVAHRSKLEKVTFLVLASDRAASFESSSHNQEPHVELVDPKGTTGLATGISEDGYLLTAAHVTRREYCYVVGWMDGQPVPFPARVVHKKVDKKLGADWAILHVDKHLDAHLQLGTLDSAESEIYAFGLDWKSGWKSITMDRQSGLKFSIIAGNVVGKPKLIPGKDMSIMETDLPLWKGDSGSAVMSKDEKLVGVFVGVDLGWPKLKNSAIVCVPDMARLASIIAKDRLQAHEPDKTPQPTDAVPGK